MKDILKAKDYIFTAFTGSGQAGDSGPLLLAINKNDNSERYVVKHYFVDCAGNEYVASKLGNAIHASFPECKLFDLSEYVDASCFHTEYVVGIEWLDDLKDYDFSEGTVANSDDFYKYVCLQYLFSSFDSFEVMRSQGRLFKIDNTDGFNISENFSSPIRLSIMSTLKPMPQKLYTELEEKIRKQSFSFGNNNVQSIIDQLNHGLELIKSDTGFNPGKIFLQTLHNFTHISQIYIEDMLANLAGIYPEYVCVHYRKYIECAKEASKIILADW